MNCGNPIGVAQMQGNYRNGVRQSASARYLGPIVGRPNLQVLTGAVAQRIIFRGGRATGLQYSHRGRIRTQEAGLEILLASGVVNSPQLLQLSGVGDPKDIMPHKIAVTHELPGVGKNLRDHLSVTVKQRLTRPYSLLQELRPLAKVKALSQYLLFKSGPTAVGGLEAWAHLNSRPDIEYPDIQLYTIPLMYNDHGRDVIDEEGFQLVLNGCRPNSSGSIRIASGDPGTAPLIDPQYLADPEDLRVLREGIRLARDIIAQPAYSDFRGAEYSPGGVAASDAALDSYIRSTAQTIYHPGRDVQDGIRRSCRRRPVATRSWHRRTKGRRCLGHARHRERQHQFPCHDDRGKSSPDDHQRQCIGLTAEAQTSCGERDPLICDGTLSGVGPMKMSFARDEIERECETCSDERQGQINPTNPRA